MADRPGQIEQELIKQAAQGSSEAFEGLVGRYQDRLYGVIHRMVGDAELARDLTQETFLKAWKGLPRFQGNSAFYTWIFRIGRNVVTSEARKRAARPKVSRSLEGPDGETGIEPADEGQGPQGQSLQDERRTLVLDAVAALPDEFREIVVLRDMDDRSYEEIAELLEIAVGTVRSRLHRARSALKERLRTVLHPATDGS